LIIKILSADCRCVHAVCAAEDFRRNGGPGGFTERPSRGDRAVASAAAPRTHPTIASGFTGRVAPIDYKNNRAVDNKNIGDGLSLRPQYAQPRV
jgi:hypothetical protein